jgi:acyl dehydratase
MEGDEMGHKDVKQLYFEDIEVGQPIPPLVVGALSPTTVVKFQAATGEFAAPHHDYEFARSLGLPGTILPGPLMFAYQAQLMTDWIGPGGWLSELRAGFKGIGLVGHEFCVEGTVVNKYFTDGENWVECDVGFRDVETDAKVTTGKAVIRLPSKEA